LKFRVSQDNKTKSPKRPEKKLPAFLFTETERTKVSHAAVDLSLAPEADSLSQNGSRASCIERGIPKGLEIQAFSSIITPKSS